jgi:MFS family permease
VAAAGRRRAAHGPNHRIRQPSGAERSAPSTTRLLRVPGLLPVLATNFAYLWMVAVVFDTLVPLFGHDALGMSTAGIGVVFAIALATEFAVLYPAGSAADRRGRKPVLAPALAGLAVMTAAVGWATAPWLLLVLMAVLGVMSGTAGIPPGAMLSDLAPSDRQGTAVGLFRFCGDLGFTLGPLLAGWAVPALGFRWTFTLLAGPTVGALVLILRAPETLRPAAPG